MKNLRNQSGALSLDFLFALMLVMGTTVVFGMFCFTLSLIEIIQYTAYSSSRAYFAGNIDRAAQIRLAENVFDKLVNGKFAYFLSPKKDWFIITPNFGDFSNLYGGADGRDVFIGARFNVQAKLLGMTIPFVGSTERENGYKTTVTSFLGREVTSKECMEMIEPRYTRIKALDESYGLATTTSGTGYVAFDDNGC